MAQTNDAQGSKLEDMATNREQFQKLCALGIEEELKASLSADVKKELLESLSSIQLENIDVDTNHGGRASSVMYFQPFPPIEGEMKQVLSWGWSEMSPGEAPWVYPEHKAGWFMGPWDESATLEDDETEIDRFGGSAWRCIEDRCCVRDTTGLVLPSGHVFCNPTAYTHSSEYFSDFAFFPKDEKKPHLACIISDTFISPDMILRSEVHGAVALIMHQLAIKRFSDHRVKPVMLYTFQGDEYARITEAYYDPAMDKIVLRQSRQLDLRGPEPTEDAWLLMRWMLSTPVGDTLIKSGESGLPIHAKEPVVSPLKPTNTEAA